MKALLENNEITTKTGRRTIPQEQSIKERVITAAKHYLEKRGYEIIQKWENDAHLGFVTINSDAIVFIHVISNGLDKKGFPNKPTISRDDFEQLAIRWFADQGHGYVDMPVRFDELALKVLCADRALLRHHINILQSNDDMLCTS